MQLVRSPTQPPCVAPPHPLPRHGDDGDDGRPPKVRIKHPGYNGPTDTLIILHTFDPLPSELRFPTGQGDAVDSAEASVGLHHGTVLTICAIIANKAFDVYLTCDREGTRRVEQHGQPDSILPAGTYWAQVPQPTSTRTEAGQQDTREPTSATQEPAVGAVTTPYPVVPDFQNWRFPHGQVPSPWLKDHEPPSLQDTSASTSACRQIADKIQALHGAHIVPSSEMDWFYRNGMREYLSWPESLENHIDLRADLRRLFDSNSLTIVPKPVSVTPSTSTSTSTSKSTSGTAESSQATRYALAVDVLYPAWTLDVFARYHNQALWFLKNSNQFTEQYQESRELLFARFAWSIFPLLQEFLNGSARLLAIRVDGQQANTSAAAPNPHDHEYRWSVVQVPYDESYSGGETHTEDSPPRRKRRRRSSELVFQPEQASEQLLGWMAQLGEAEAEGSSLFSQPPGQTDVVGADEEPGGVGV